MNRAIFVVLLLAFFAFATIGGTGGMQPSGEQMAHARTAASPGKSQQDRCQLAPPCLAPCLQCAVGMPAEFADLAGGTSVKAERHRTQAERAVSGRLYRPPRA